jgi:putative endonuclease
MKRPCIYILTNDNNSTVYIGVTSHLVQRIYLQKNKQVKGFSSKYNLNKRVYFEQLEDMDSAIRERKGSRNGTENRLSLLGLFWGSRLRWNDV